MFYLKDTKKTRSAIIIIYRYKGERYKLPTGESVLVSFWNKERERCETGRKYPEGIDANRKLDVIETDIKRVFVDFNLKNIIPSLNEVKEAYDKLTKGAGQSDVYFSDYVKESIEKLKESKAKFTIQSYNTTLKKLNDYEKYIGKRLKFSDINIDFYTAFKAWFFTTANTRNYFGTQIKNIKKFMNDSFVDGIHSYEGHKHPQFKIEAEDVDTVYLSMDELKTIYHLEISEKTIKDMDQYKDTRMQNIRRKVDSLNMIRARFLIGAFTLLRVSDYKRLTDVNIKDGLIRIKPKKRSKGRMNRDVVIPMHPIVKEILESGFDLESTISEQKINKHIKEICQFAGITGDEIVVRTEKGKEVERHFKKYELITTHTARRSAATNMLMAGIEASDIMILGGWNSEKSFWKYIRLEPEMNAKRLAEHAFFK